MKRVAAVALLLASLDLVAGIAEQLPKLKVTTLAGTEVTIPGDPKVAAYVLTFGFSRNSAKAMAAWDKQIAPVFSNAPKVAYFEIPVLEGVPGLVKGFILRGMRRSTSKQEQSRFAPAYAGEAALKRIVGFGEPDAAYVVVTDRDGTVVWSSHAAPSDVGVQSLRDAVGKLLKSPGGL